MYFVPSTWRPVSITQLAIQGIIDEQLAERSLAKLPKPKDDEDGAHENESEPPLPQTLVRIPTQHAPALLAQPTSGSNADAE